MVQNVIHVVKVGHWQRAYKSKTASEVTGCKQQYFYTDSAYACNLGCNKGQDVNKARKLPTSPDKVSPHKTQHGTVAAMILRPVMLLHTYGRGMINKLTYYVQSSTSYYFRTNNGAMVVVNIQGEPEIHMRVPKHPDIQEDEPPETKSVELHGSTEHHESWIVVRRGHHWLHCVSHKSGVPMWILSSILFLSSFFLLWLCCASTAIVRKNKKSFVEKKAFLIKDCLPASKEKVGEDVALLKLDDDEEQAEPLPSKIPPAFIDM